MGFFDALSISRLKEGLARTRDSIVGKVQRLLATRSKIDDDVLERLEEILLSADVGVATTTLIIDRLRERVKADKYEEAGQLDGILREEVQKLMGNGTTSTDTLFDIPKTHRPHVVLVVGVNGVGKTTTIGKLAHNYRQAGRAVLIAAADTFRAAANEQLDIWAERAGVEIISQKHGADPAAVAYDSLNAAVARNIDVLIIDTAGRLHTKVNLMEELKKIGRVLRKVVSDAPHEVLLVLDASTGQNAIRQAKEFSKSVQVTGLVLTKLDGTAKGGVIIGIANELEIPVKFIGVGEQIGDLQPFDKKLFVEALFAQ